MSDPRYCYPPDFSVLRNRQDLRDLETLKNVENEAVTFRLRQGPPQGDFSLNHLRAIHHHLFQDVYEWAGEVREIDIGKGETAFLPVSRIELGMNDIHERLIAQDFLRGLNQSEFSKAAAETLGDVNYVHPFREGNGRTQLQYLRQLCEQAGHSVDLSQFDRESWINASIKTCRPSPEYRPVEACIDAALSRTRQLDAREAAYEELAHEAGRDEHTIPDREHDEERER